MLQTAEDYTEVSLAYLDALRRIAAPASAAATIATASATAAAAANSGAAPATADAAGAATEGAVGAAGADAGAPAAPRAQPKPAADGLTPLGAALRGAFVEAAALFASYFPDHVDRSLRWGGRGGGVCARVCV